MFEQGEGALTFEDVMAREGRRQGREGRREGRREGKAGMGGEEAREGPLSPNPLLARLPPDDSMVR